MGLSGVIVGLEQLKRPSEVNVCADLMHVVHGIEEEDEEVAKGHFSRDEYYSSYDYRLNESFGLRH